MKTSSISPLRFLFFLVVSWLFAYALTVSASGLSEAAADTLIEAEITSKANRDAERRLELEQIPALQEWVVRSDEGDVIMRRIEPQIPSAREGAETDKTTSQPIENEVFTAPVDSRPHKSLTLFITVFDREITELRSRHGSEEEVLTTLSNVDWSWLPAITTLESESAIYTVLAFVEHVDRETDEARTRPDPAVFSTSAPEYVIYSETDTSPPGAVEAIDALHRHYLENKTQFETEARRAAILREARARYLEKNPPEPGETVINFAPVRSRIYK